MFMQGKIVGLNVKDKTLGEVGLPKIAMKSAKVTKEGVEGDYNHYRAIRKKNTADRALLLYTVDKFDELGNEGWPIKTGDLGENVTIEGLSYDDLKIGSIVKIGDIQCQITEKCNPCKNLEALSYVGDRITEFIKTMKGRRGWYAKVLKEGTIAPGDVITIVDY